MLDGLDAVRSRIDSLESLATGAEPGPLDAAGRSLGATAEFDPFGDMYQAALEQRDRAGAVPPGGASSFQALASRSSGLAIGGLNGLDTAQLGAAITGHAGVPGARPVGGYGSMPVPDALRAYGNGQIPRSALVEIDQSGHRLFAPAAASWDNLVAAARADGIDMRITDSYRSYEQQVDLVRRKGLYSEGGLGARPGTSNHGWGLAVDADVTDDRTYRWLQANGPRFGWVEAVPREPWHWEFRPHQV